ncbi:MAG TPA: glycosyltransferase family A protein [Steroidobacteraceae bacterium]|nr:glycosyltransferase family A protein [Steroidobacteraceae bacterium]
MAKVAVWLTNYNNEKHIGKAIESVLRQVNVDFHLYIFDNHSTDGAPNIIAQYAADPRVMRVEILQGLAGIGLMAFAWDYIANLNYDYSITLGGHDIWATPQHLEALVGRAEAEKQAGQRVALVYCDTFQLNEDDQIIGRFLNHLQQAGNMGRPFVPQWVMSGIDCPPFFGLWNEEVRRQIPVRHQCAGWDHMVVIHASTRGAILYEPQARLAMRAPPPGDGLDKYGKRHFTPAQLQMGTRDFFNQLEWLNVCIDEACSGLGEERDFHRAMLTTSMFSTYLLLRGYNMHVFPGAMEAFNANPLARKAVQQCIEAAEAVRSLTA